MHSVSRRSVWLSLVILLAGGFVRADESPQLFPSAATPPATRVGAVLGFIVQPVVRDDLKLTDEQQSKIAELSERYGGLRVPAAIGVRRGDREAQALAERDAAIAELAAVLTPEQVRRHWQVVLQRSLTAEGLQRVLASPEIADAIGLDAAQRDRVSALREELADFERAQLELEATKTRLERFGNPDLALVGLRRSSERLASTNAEIGQLLTVAQKERALELLGRPVIGRVDQPALVVRASRTFPSREFRIGSLDFSPLNYQPLLAIVRLAADDLELSPEQRRSLPAADADPETVAEFMKQIEQRLTPGQWTRVQQLELQYARLADGPAAVFKFKRVVDGLQVNDPQRTAITELVRVELQSTADALRERLYLEASDTAARRRAFVTAVDGILTAAQRQQLADFAGKPFAGDLKSITQTPTEGRMSVRSRLARELGVMSASDTLRLRLTLSIPYVDFGLPDEVMDNIARLPPTQRSDADYLKLMTAGEWDRFRQVLLQLYVRAEGPTIVFRQGYVVDGLALSEEQRRQILEAIRADTREYLKIPLAELSDKLPALDTKTAAALDALLNDGQRAKLGELIGEPLRVLERPRLPGRGPAPQGNN